ncbi:mucin-desulfating sulfatase (N-acetylglucosamine-6-sulfatase) [Rhodopirellula maiorica SM1]|uniref:Mucin-desulfating sulfatase (N-acetylglucosamine-6-sulfatase) n=1 Tax=Rhodopirellula maiorica SM1 TaxID=1265738 RepID=M5S5X9_9BACT|nr:sulfatase [Rhodopirellula maiorica]EMI21604.1 mucin-desulfating sulfatase (N-acetylglucosamine-6-sulfatase) [Rhodopirellula maiorica SM1]
MPANLCLAEIRNVVFILSDDHRYDFMGFMDEAPDFLETPNLDRMAGGGIHVRNAFVTTSLCSPSRASILTGRYMHAHHVVDNQRPVPAGTRFFPEYLQNAGVKTAFVGKWHMGHDSDERRPGFDHWVSFKGQGDYFDPELNVNGDRRQFEGYNADILTDQAIQWIDAQSSDSSVQPFFLYLSYKAVHYPFKPAPRHQGRYANSKIDYPETMANTEENYQTQSHWIRDRRYSIHGIDHMETGAFDNDPVPSFDSLYRDYCETVHSVDENIGRVLDTLEAAGQLDSTLVLYMGDNGFALGEHGFYDKRDAFEESIRVPMLAYAPTNLPAGKTIDPMIQNIDIASTVLDAMKVDFPADAEVDGRSFLPLLKGENTTWRDHILYEYHWEWNFPATPTLFAIRDKRFKYVYYHGVWDQNGFYDLQTDPHERHNLIDVPGYREQVERMSKQMFDELSAMGGLNVPVRPPQGERLGSRKLPR